MADSKGPELEKQVSAQLAERIAACDPDAEQQFCERYYQRLLFFIRKRTLGDAALAEDICQQSFLKALEKLRAGELRNPASLAAFVHGIAVHDVMNETKKTQRRATEADMELIEKAADRQAGPLERVSDEQVSKELRKCLDLLSESDRRVLIRLYLHDEDRKSICDSEGYSAAQLNNIVWRAKQRLKKQILALPEEAQRTAPSVVRLMR